MANPAWRPMTADDLDGVVAVAAIGFPDHREDRACFESRLSVFPAGCFVLADKDAVKGYLIAYPWPLDSAPVLNRPIDAIPPDADILYLHDLALHPDVRGGGWSRPAMATVHGLAEACGRSTIALVAVNDAVRFWQGHGFMVRDTPDLANKLARYGPDALRYYICAAGPETSDAAFTWADFVTRNNSELVAGWGNLVNRTATMIAKSFGEIPAAGPLEEVDEQVLATVRDGFASVGDLVEKHRLRAAVAEAMRIVGEVNKYLTVTEPYKMKDESQRERLGTVLHVAVQCVSDCNTLLSPFLPHSANKVHAVLGGQGEFMPMPRIEQVDELEPDNGAGHTSYSVITGDYAATPAWESRPVVVGAKVDKPTPVFTKLDPSVVEEELSR